MQVDSVWPSKNGTLRNLEQKSYNSPETSCNPWYKPEWVRSDVHGATG